MKPKADKRIALRSPASSSLSLRAEGFTLVELLVVISIIIILAGILVPSLDYARTFAKSTSSKALIHSLSAGVDMYKIEKKLGGTYPPSISGTAYGAQTLVWGLAGKDLLGTKGFDANGTYSSSTVIYGPFIDVSKTEIKAPNALKPVITLADNSPVFVDAFGRPVLYFEPNASGSYVRADNDGFLSSSHIADDANFNAYIQDYRVWQLSATYSPHNRDSYILISAGPDKTYGTADDVDNFDPSAR